MITLTASVASSSVAVGCPQRLLQFFFIVVHVCDSVAGI